MLAKLDKAFIDCKIPKNFVFLNMLAGKPGPRTLSFPGSLVDQGRACPPNPAQSPVDAGAPRSGARLRCWPDLKIC